MTNQQMIENFVKTLTRKINHRIEAFAENYETAKAAVKQESCAGVAVWEILDKQFA